MTTIERAARALADVMFVKRVRDCEAPSAQPMVRPIGWENLSAADRSSAMEAARAFLQAIREPSEAMLEAGKCTRQHWSRMIDAALAEGA